MPEIYICTCAHTHTHTHAHTHTRTHTQDLVDVDIFLTCQKVEEALRNHNTGPCLSYCHENRSKLRRSKSNLEFHVRLQDFIELVRDERRIEAIKYVCTLKCYIGIKSMCTTHMYMCTCVCYVDHVGEKCECMCFVVMIQVR